MATDIEQSPKKSARVYDAEAFESWNEKRRVKWLADVEADRTPEQKLYVIEFERRRAAVNAVFEKWMADVEKLAPDSRSLMLAYALAALGPTARPKYTHELRELADTFDDDIMDISLTEMCDGEQLVVMYRAVEARIEAIKAARIEATQ